MRRCLFSFVVMLAAAVLLAGCDASTTASGETSARTLGFDIEELNFGEVVLGDTVERIVTLHNPNDAPLRISGVATSCGCTRVVDQPQEARARGDTSFRLQFTGEGRPGVETAGELTVALASGEVLTLPIRGTAVNAISATPDAIEIGEEVLVTLTSLDGIPFRVIGVEHAESAALPSAPASVHALAVTFGATDGLPPSAVIFRTDHTRMPVVAVRTNYQPPEIPSLRAAVRPDRITASIDPSGAMPIVEVTVFAPDTVLNVDTPEVRQNGSDWRVRDAVWSEDGRRCTVILEMPNAASSPSRSEVLLVFGDFVALCRIQLTGAEVQPINN